MPIREYRCDDGHITEHIALRKEEDVDKIECKICGKPAEKIMSLSADNFPGADAWRHPAWRPR